jgi:hypothetical protein
MSSYQQVRVIKKDGNEITLLVKETNNDMEAIHLLIGKKMLLTSSKKKQAAIFAGFLLSDYNDRDNSFIDGLCELDELPAPTEAITKVEFLSLMPTGEIGNGPLYQAEISITVAKSKWLSSFKPTKKKTYFAAAYGLSDWDDVVG